MRYLTVSGVLLDEMSLRLEAGFQVDEPPGPSLPAASPDAMIVVSLDGQGNALDRTVIPTVPMCLHGAGLHAPRLAAGLIPVVPRVSILRFIFHDQIVHEFAVPEGAPDLRLIWQPEGEQLGSQILSWDAHHPGGAELTFAAVYTVDGSNWIPLCLPQPDSSTAVDFDSLPGGSECRIRVMATDGMNTSVVESEPFSVPIKGLLPLILEPDDGAQLPLGTLVTFVGQVMSREETDQAPAAELRWSSSLDGDLGAGAYVEAELSPGQHTISLATTDADGDHEAFITVIVQPDPCRPAD